MTRRLISLFASLMVVGALLGPPAQARPGGPRLVRAPGTQAPRLVVPPVAPARPGDPVAIARSHLDANRSVYHVDPFSQLRVLERIEHPGDATVRFGQVHRGVPVFGAQYLVHLEKSPAGAAVSSVNGHLFTELDPPSKPRLSEVEAERLAELRTRPLIVGNVSPQGLMIVPIGEGVLAYGFTLEGRHAGAPAKRTIFINAVTGGVALSYGELRFDGSVTGTGQTSHGGEVPLNLYQRGGVFEFRDRARSMFGATGGEIKTHDLNGGTSYVGTDGNLVSGSSLAFSGSHTSSGAVDAHWGAGQVYEYFLSLGRESIDGQGATITSLVNAADIRTGGPLFNAFWDGEKMIYGNPNPDELHPLPAALDVVGHELTHGVTQSSGGLVYLNQSGAMDEAYADYFGQAIDLAASPATPPEHDGFIGEDLCKVPEPTEWECPLRDLNDGRTASDYLYYLSDFDGGGVHDNATIYAGALWDLRQELGGERVDPIVLKALTEFTTPLDEFIDGRNSVISAAQALGATSEEIAAVNRVFDAKGIVEGWDQPDSAGESTLVADIFQSTPNYSAPQVSGSRFTIANHADKSRVEDEPMQIYVGSVDGSTPLLKVGDDANPRTFNDEAPDISGARVAWTHLHGGSGGLDADVRGRKIGRRARSIASGPSWQWYPAMHRKTVVWEQARSNSDIWMRRGTAAPVRVAGGRAEQWLPQVWGDWVAWWLPGDGSGGMGIGVKNVRTGKALVLKGPSRGAFVGPPAVGPRYVAWYQDANSDGVGSIVRAKLGSSRRKVLVPEDSDTSPVWLGGRLTGVAAGPALSAGADFVAYTDERALAAKFFGDLPVPDAEVGRDIWVVPVAGGVARLATSARGDQGYPAAGDGGLLLWLDGRAGRTDLVGNR